MYESILVPIDGSSGSDEATEEAVGLAKVMGSSVTFVFVMDTVRHFQEGVMLEVLARLKREGQTYLERAEKVASDAGVLVESELLEGDPIDVISDRAQEFDLIVMGRSEKGLWKRITMGSVTEGVLRKLPCSLLVVAPFTAST